MNRYPQDIYSTVEKKLRGCVQARNSDVFLYKEILKDFYGTTDLSKINLDGDIFASIKRARQKIQENNPFLGPTENVKRKRLKMEQTFLDFGRNW